MKKLVLVCVMMALMASVAAYGDGITWYAVANYLYYENGSTYLDGNASSALGCFAQLLWVGPNGTIDLAYIDGADGTGLSDDVVVGTGWVGEGSALGADGWFDGTSVLVGGDVTSNGVYFARVWSAPAANYATGLAPVSPTNRYVNSGLWTFPQVDPVADSFEIASSALSTTLTPQSVIPEPAVLGLALIGLISLRLSVRKKK